MERPVALHMSQQFNSFAEFWPHYVTEHSRPATRLLHLIGTSAGIACAVFFIATGRWWLFPIGLVPGYGAAWIAHFFIERNKPATFQYPLWSFLGDYKMIGMMLSGRMKTEVERVTQIPTSTFDNMLGGRQESQNRER